MEKTLEWFIDSVESEGLVLVNNGLAVIHKNALASSITDKFPNLLTLLDLKRHDPQRVSLPIPEPSYMQFSLGQKYIDVEIQARPVPFTTTGESLWLIHIRPLPGRDALLTQLEQVQYLVETGVPGLALYTIDLATTRSRTLFANKKYLELLRITAEELHRDGLYVPGRVVLAEDRKKVDKIFEEALLARSTFMFPFRMVYEGECYWRFCRGTFRGYPNMSEVLAVFSIEDYTQGMQERELAELALSSSMSLECLMEQLFEVQFYVDDSLRIVDQVSPSCVNFFKGQVPLSLHDVLADIDSASRLVKYLASRPVMKAGETVGIPTQTTPSIITISLHAHGEVQVFALSAFLEKEEVVSASYSGSTLIDAISGVSVPSELLSSGRTVRKFLIAMRSTTSQTFLETLTLSPEQPGKVSSQFVNYPMVELAYGRSLRGLIMESLTALHAVKGSTSIPGMISLSFSNRSLEWSLEELLLVTPCKNQPELIAAAQALDIDRCVSLFNDLKPPSLLFMHLLMAIAARQPIESRLKSFLQLDRVRDKLVQDVSQLTWERPVLELEFAALVAKEAVNSPDLFKKDRSWLITVLVRGLEAPLRNPNKLYSLVPVVFFVALLVADFSYKVGKLIAARELLAGVLADIESFRTTQGQGGTLIINLGMVAAHNLAVDALSRNDLTGAFNHVIRLSRFAKQRPPPPTCQDLLNWALRGA